MGFLAGKRYLIVGVASDRSIATGIAEAMHREGAELAFTYQNDKLKSRVLKAAERYGSSEAMCFPCDVTSDADIDAVFAELGKQWDGLDGIVHAVGFAPATELDGNFVDVATREGFQIAHDISSYSFVALAKAGKSMLASRLPGLLPSLRTQQALEVAAIHSLKQPRDSQVFYQRPYRAPHHTSSATALVGGGSYPKPGEISLAHHGILFLDELPEFDRRVLEVLREPLETGEVSIARAAQQLTFPARFQLVAAMNPCPCGFLGDPEKSCGYRCEKAKRYQAKLSGPLLDRIDLHLDVPAVDAHELLGDKEGESSAQVRQRVLQAWQQQWQRQQSLNRDLSPDDLEPLLRPHRDWLAGVMNRLGLSARALHRSIRVARTIADLAQSEEVERDHLREALSYRQNIQQG